MVKKQYYNRGRIEITADIIKGCTQETKKTRIMFSANLSYEQVTAYLEDLQKIGLIEQVTIDGDNFYEVTARGREFLNAYDSMKQIFDDSVSQQTYKRYSVI